MSIWEATRSPEGLDNIRDYNRARGRALSRIRDLHRKEYEALLAAELGGVDRIPLKPGRRKLTAEQEIDRTWLIPQSGRRP